jgi:hypothetical protein
MVNRCHGELAEEIAARLRSRICFHSRAAQGAKENDEAEKIARRFEKEK